LVTASSTPPKSLAARIAPRLDSLAARLIAAAAVWTILGLVIGGYFLSASYRGAVERDFDASLSDDLAGLIAAAEPDRDAGRRADDKTQISKSLFDKSIVPANLRRVDEQTWGTAEGPEGQPLRILERRLEFPIRTTRRTDDFHAYMFLVAADLTKVETDVSEFKRTVFWSFVILGAGLIIAVLLQVRVGLLPLRRLATALARIRNGQSRRLEGTYPAEIAPLASELNSLIEHSAEVVGRARTHVSNLAHFLKTPLTVLTSEAQAQPGPLADAVTRHVGTMRRQVDHYLARARAAGAVDVLGNRTPVKPVLEDLARVLRRIHAERNLEITVNCPPGISFRGERQDLEEMAGNLMDNACKWADRRIGVAVASLSGAVLEIRVDDDGPGLEPEERERAVERGERLDESVPGSGLGLAIVRDIAKLYGGSLNLGDSPAGGLDARLILPAIV